MRRILYDTVSGRLHSLGSPGSFPASAPPGLTMADVPDTVTDQYRWEPVTRTWVQRPPPRPRRGILAALNNDTAFAAFRDSLSAPRKIVLLDALRDFFDSRVPSLEVDD